jgi:hypothetical protein
MPTFLLILAAGVAWWWAAGQGGDADPSSVPATPPEPAIDPALGADAWVSGFDLIDPPTTTNVLGLEVSTMKTYTPPKSAAPYLETIAQAAQKYGLPDGLLARVLFQESRFREDIITGQLNSPTGAQGIAQFMPATARDLGVDPLNPNSAIPGAAKYLRSLFDQTGDWVKAVAAYNWGIGNVKRKGLAAAPAETRQYIADISKDVDLS